MEYMLYASTCVVVLQEDDEGIRPNQTRSSFSATQDDLNSMPPQNGEEVRRSAGFRGDDNRPLGSKDGGELDGSKLMSR